MRFDGARLRARRNSLGLSPDEVARLACLSSSALRHLERNEKRPSIGSLERLCGALDCSPDALFSPGGDDGADLRPTELGPDTDAWIRRMLADAPPLTARQAEHISAVLFEKAAP